MSPIEPSYSDKLKDPRWQKKRLEFLAHAGWKCEKCGSTDKELHVHHKKYVRGQPPWVCELADLSCLCKACHDLLHNPVTLNIYLAGRITKSGWRHEVVKGLREAWGVDEKEPEPPAMIPKSIFDQHNYVGPFFKSCDHGCYHGRGTHAQLDGCYDLPEEPDKEESYDDLLKRQNPVINRSMAGIRRCDFFFAWLDSKECYGTFVEIGYAKALGKFVSVGINKIRTDLWFPVHFGRLIPRTKGPIEALKISIDWYFANRGQA